MLLLRPPKKKHERGKKKENYGDIILASRRSKHACAPAESDHAEASRSDINDSSAKDNRNVDGNEARARAHDLTATYERDTDGQHVVN